MADRILCGHNKWKEKEENLSILRDRIKTDYTWGLGEKQRLSACPLCSCGTSGVNLFGVPAKVRGDLLFFVELLIQLSNARDRSSGAVLCIEIFFLATIRAGKKNKNGEKEKSDNRIGFYVDRVKHGFLHTLKTLEFCLTFDIHPVMN